MPGVAPLLTTEAVQITLDYPELPGNVRKLVVEAGGRSEERRVGKECRSRCDWSSDVCSSDLDAGGRAAAHDRGGADHARLPRAPRQRPEARRRGRREIGRASCRERV